MKCTLDSYFAQQLSQLQLNQVKCILICKVDLMDSILFTASLDIDAHFSTNYYVCLTYTLEFPKQLKYPVQSLVARKLGDFLFASLRYSVRITKVYLEKGMYPYNTQ